MDNKIKVGIIGCGGIAFNKHLPSLKKIEQVEIVALCDRNEHKAQQALTQFDLKNAKVYTDYRDVNDDVAIDVIHVCTSNDSHAEITIDALEKGKHVMCEKPIALTALQANDMIDTAKRVNKKLSVGYNNRFRKDSQQLYQICRRGDLGDIYFAKAHAVRRRGVPNRGSFLNKDLQGGGPLIDIGTHALDLTLWMMDNYKPKSVLGTSYHKLSQVEEAARNGGWNQDEFRVEDSAFGMIVMENEATIMLESSWALNVRHEGTAKVTLCGTKAGADMWDGLWINGEELGGLYDKNMGVVPVGIPSFEDTRAGAIDLEMKMWIDAIENDKEVYVKPEEAIVVSQIIDALYESAKTGKAVYFS